MVDPTGFEPATFRLSSETRYQLRHGPTFVLIENERFLNNSEEFYSSQARIIRRGCCSIL